VFCVAKTCLYMGSSNNTLNSPPKKKGRLDKWIVCNVLFIVMIPVCDLLVTLWQELGQPIFLEGIFGLTHIETYYTCRLEPGRFLLFVWIDKQIRLCHV